MSTSNLTFFNFFFTSRTSWATSGKRTIVQGAPRQVAAGSGCLGLQLRNRTIVPRIPSSRGPSLLGITCCQVQAEQLHAIPTAAWPAGPRQPEQLFVFWAGRRLVSLPIPNNYSLFAAGTWDAWFKPEQSFGLAARPGWATTRKANNGWFLRVWW